MKEQKMHKNYIAKLEAIRNLLKSSFPDLDVQKINEIMSKLAHFHYNKRKFVVGGFERELYNFLIENSYNPFTVYRWLLLEKLPEDLRFQLRQRQISQKHAVSEYFERRHETSHEIGQSIKEMGLNLIRRM